MEPIPTLEDTLTEPPDMEITLEEFHASRRELSKRAES